MNEYLIAEFLNSVESVNQPIQFTQRIKYTTFDVSVQYIIFGASSGGLYIFNRHPCTFIKLIPSTEGSVVHLCISPDEKNFAVATSKGSLCLVNNSDSISKDIQVYNEHQGNIVTSMTWNNESNELYTGDNSGKISVVFVRNFISKSMFQTPSATLMQLDSRIVQLDWTSRFLLASTLSRCYLCDTETEHYRQIGKKLRDGEFGACFFGSKYTNSMSSERKVELGSFRILSDKESFAIYDGLEDLKLFCARPGSRFWEVQLDGTVVRTHQFKQALALGPRDIVAFPNDLDCCLSNKHSLHDATNSQSINFVKLQVINKQFILAYQRNGLYIFDPMNATVVFWTDVYTDIVDVKIMNKVIYLWTSKSQLYVLLFSTVEDLILKSFMNKKYLLCADLCQSYQKHIKKILPLSKKLYLLSNLKEKLLEQHASELIENFEPIFNMIKEISYAKSSAQKLINGIFVVDNGHINNYLLEDSAVTDTKLDRVINTAEQSEDKTGETKCDTSVASFEQILQSTNLENDDKHDNKNIFRLLLEEYELYKINNRYKTNALQNIFGTYLLVNEVINVFIEFENYVQSLYLETQEIQIWGYEKCLEYIESRKDLEYGPFNSIFDKYIQDAYGNINAATGKSCICGYPYPAASLNKPKFYETGRSIIETLYVSGCQTALDLCCKVPYLWKHIINLRKNENVETLLPLLIQYSDVNVLYQFIDKFTYDLWNDFLKKFILLSSGKCLNCEQEVDSKNSVLSWNTVASQMIVSIGAESTVFLLFEHAQCIPSNQLGVDFYQSSIFTTIVDSYDETLRKNAVEFVSNINKTSCDIAFGKLLEKNLLNPQVSNTVTVPNNKTNMICSYCKLPLQVPVLRKEKNIELKCGHILHNICYETQNKCFICSGE